MRYTLYQNKKRRYEMNTMVMAEHNGLDLVQINNKGKNVYQIWDREELTEAGLPTVMAEFNDAFEAMKQFVEDAENLYRMVDNSEGVELWVRNNKTFIIKKNGVVVLKTTDRREALRKFFEA
jgi:hypothetical protein